MDTRNKRMRPWLVVVVAAVSSIAGGCYDDYLDRSNTLTLGIADATETNKALQTINRWPPSARHDRWHSDGERARDAIERYRARQVTNPLKPNEKPPAASPAASGGAPKN